MSLTVEIARRCPTDALAIAFPSPPGRVASFPVLVDTGAMSGAAAASARALLPPEPDQAWLRGRESRPRWVSRWCYERQPVPRGGLAGFGCGMGPEAWRRAGAALVRAAGEVEAPPLWCPMMSAMTAPSRCGAGRGNGARRLPLRPLPQHPQTGPVDRVVVVTESDEVAAGVRRGMVSGSAVVFARDLVNTPQ